MYESPVLQVRDTASPLLIGAPIQKAALRDVQENAASESERAGSLERESKPEESTHHLRERLRAFNSNIWEHYMS